MKLLSSCLPTVQYNQTWSCDYFSVLFEKKNLFDFQIQAFVSVVFEFCEFRSVLQPACPNKLFYVLKSESHQILHGQEVSADTVEEKSFSEDERKEHSSHSSSLTKQIKGTQLQLTSTYRECCCKNPHELISNFW